VTVRDSVPLFGFPVTGVQHIFESRFIILLATWCIYLGCLNLKVIRHRRDNLGTVRLRLFEDINLSASDANSFGQSDRK
jgi:hypothetical protein